MNDISNLGEGTHNQQEGIPPTPNYTKEPLQLTQRNLFQLTQRNLYNSHKGTSTTHTKEPLQLTQRNHYNSHKGTSTTFKKEPLPTCMEGTTPFYTNKPLQFE